EGSDTINAMPSSRTRTVSALRLIQPHTADVISGRRGDRAFLASGHRFGDLPHPMLSDFQPVFNPRATFRSGPAVFDECLQNSFTFQVRLRAQIPDRVELLIVRKTLQLR